MLRLRNIVTIFVLLVATPLIADYVNKKHSRPWKVRFYPKDTVFKKADLIDKGCVVFIRQCPAAYKKNVICARHYDGQYRTFTSYCEMEYENCNGWRTVYGVLMRAGAESRDLKTELNVMHWRRPMSSSRQRLMLIVAETTASS